jgi:hypothetical protein
LLFSAILAGLCLAVPTAALATLPPDGSTAVTGTLASIGNYSFTVQTAGRPTGVLGALTSAADRITAEDLPYVWGGGHAQAGVASVGSRGPGHNGKRRGYDCSGSVAAVLEAGGLWPAGAGVPNDAGVIQYLLQHGEIARGAGIGPGEVTLYDEPGVHIFMNINGRFFGTSDGGGGGDRKGGPGWLDDGAWDAQNNRFRRYHVLPSVLRATTAAGYTLAFQFGRGTDLSAGFPVGARVTVDYRTTNQGTMVAQSVTLVGERTLTGTVQAIAADGSSFTVVTPRGHTVGFPTAGNQALAQALLEGQVVVGDMVSVSYIEKPTLTVVSLTVTAPPTTTTPTTTTPTTTTPTTTTPTTTTPTTTTPTTTTPTTTTTTTTTTPWGGGQSGVGVGGWSGGQGF